MRRRQRSPGGPCHLSSQQHICLSWPPDRLLFLWLRLRHISNANVPLDLRHSKSENQCSCLFTASRGVCKTNERESVWFKSLEAPRGPSPCSMPPNRDTTSASRISFSPSSENSSASYHLIYFITGNPGLIGYYDTFLSTLHDLLSGTPSLPTDVFHVYGQSLAGFGDDDPSLPIPTSPYSLEYQIQRSQKSLEELRIPSGPREGQIYDSVILMGHSVGSYMVLEIIQRLRKKSSPLKIRSGILLFPTVTHIAQSPSGVKISALFRIPDFPRKASMAAKSLVWLAPKGVLKWLVGLVTRMPHGAAEVTARFLKSRMGVWQAL